MNKPLKDWTLGEIAAECEKHAGYCKADACPLFTVDTEDCKIKEICRIYPRFWIFSEPPRWTEQDKEDAKAVRHLMPWATKVGRGRDYDSLMLNSSVGLHRDLFPSLKPGESAMLDEIIGGAE